MYGYYPPFIHFEHASPPTLSSNRDLICLWALVFASNTERTYLFFVFLSRKFKPYKRLPRASRRV